MLVVLFVHSKLYTSLQYNLLPPTIITLLLSPYDIVVTRKFCFILLSNGYYHNLFKEYCNNILKTNKDDSIILGSTLFDNIKERCCGCKSNLYFLPSN